MSQLNTHQKAHFTERTRTSIFWVNTVHSQKWGYCQPLRQNGWPSRSVDRTQIFFALSNQQSVHLFSCYISTWNGAQIIWAPDTYVDIDLLAWLNSATFFSFLSNCSSTNVFANIVMFTVAKTVPTGQCYFFFCHKKNSSSFPCPAIIKFQFWLAWVSYVC